MGALFVLGFSTAMVILSSLFSFRGWQLLPPAMMSFILTLFIAICV